MPSKRETVYPTLSSTQVGILWTAVRTKEFHIARGVRRPALCVEHSRKDARALRLCVGPADARSGFSCGAEGGAHTRTTFATEPPESPVPTCCGPQWPQGLSGCAYQAAARTALARTDTETMA